MNPAKRFLFFLLPLFFLFSADLPAASSRPKSGRFLTPPESEINISGTGYERTSADKFVLTGNVQNPTPEPREIILRGQLVFFDRTAPKGDVPVFILRKDLTVILKPGESRNVEMQLINEGSMPRGALEIEPSIRVRRQSIWNY